MNDQRQLPIGTRLADWPILALGFRPFYLGAAIFAVLALPIWLAWYTGNLAASAGMSGLAWHQHEMIFGFSSAVIAGFLLTAVRNWTGNSTPTGTALAGLFLLWVAGRILMLTGPMPIVAIVDLIFLPALGFSLAIPIWRSRNKRNYKVLGIVGLLTIANFLFHLAYSKLLPYAWVNTANTLALDVITLLIAIIGGRVIPAFTANALSTADVRSDYRTEFLAIAILIAIAVTHLLSSWWLAPKGLWITFFALAAIAHTIRLVLWVPHRTFSDPLLFMLPAAYAWLPVSFVLRFLAELGVSSTGSATHALTIGAMSGLMLAMMMRSSLGHTGRPLKAGGVEICAFVLLQLSALIRVFAASLPFELIRIAVMTSGILWTLAFTVFVAAYWPILTQARIDNRPG